MNKPIIPLPTSKPQETSRATTGEGAQTALAAMIRKRKMGENHVEIDDRVIVPLPAPPEP